MEQINRFGLIDFWNNLGKFQNEVQNSKGVMEIMVHPTWQKPSVNYTKKYYQRLKTEIKHPVPRLLMHESDLDQSISAFVPKYIYHLQTVDESDAKPKVGWEPFIAAVQQINPQVIRLVGQNINFWMNIQEQQIPLNILEFNKRKRALLDSIGAKGQLVYPVQCLGSLWVMLDEQLPGTKIELTKAVHPLLFIDFQDRSNSFEANFDVLN